MTAVDGAQVVLTQRDGQTALGTIAAGVEVLIDAWLPPRDGGLRYLVASPAGAYHGWLTPANLTAIAPPPPPKRVAPPAPPPKAKPRARKQPLGTAAPGTSAGRAKKA